MSTLEYLDEQGSVTSFTLVPSVTLHNWLSELNGNPHVAGILAKGVNRGKVLEEMEARRHRGKDSLLVGGALRMMGMDRGYGRDWREFENEQGYTHLEELLIYQPNDWRKQAREYLFRYSCNLDRESTNIDDRTVWKDIGDTRVRIFMERPIYVVLFHEEIKRTGRYEPLNFLLAYRVRDPFPVITKDLNDKQRTLFMAEVSPLDYFIEFQNYVDSYDLDLLRKVGKQNAFPRICLIKELDFSDIIGQRWAKQMIRQAMVSHIWNKSSGKLEMCSNRQPLSMILAGPSGNGKTELAVWLAKLMNKPAEEDNFIKVDCGKLSDANEIFGMSGAYQGAYEGSALNNFVLRMSQEPEALGIVLLDEIEKASQDVIHGLYQVIDKGEWTNKRLTKGRGTQTETIPCHNLVFIMTTNACDQEILEFAARNQEFYATVGEDFEELGHTLENRIRGSLRFRYPFTDAFIGRVGRIIPFLPMGNGDPELQPPLLGEMMTVAKFLIERQQDKFSNSDMAVVDQLMTAKTKHRMAKIIVKEAIPEAGVRSIQKGVETRMGDKMIHSLLLEKGGIQHGSQVEYYAKEEEMKVDFRAKESGAATVGLEDIDAEEVEDEDMYG